MDHRMVFKEAAVKEEFLDRLAELREHAGAGGLESLEGGDPGTDRARDVADAMAEGAYQPGTDRGLEAIIERFTRPVYLVQDSTIVDPQDDFPNSEVIAAQLSRARGYLETAIPSSGRIDVRNHRLDWVGTAWVVGPDLVVTNRHVANEFAVPADGAFAFRRNLDGTRVSAVVDWRHEYQRGEESRFRIEDIVWIEPEGSVDVALLRISGLGENGEPVPPPIELMTAEELADTPTGAWVAVIGYPAFDSRNNTADQQRIFDGVFNYKRVAPGEITYFSDQPVLHHDATTLGGNSGSVVVDLERGKAIGLHFGGIQGARNEAVQAARVQEIIAQHGS